MRVEHPQGPADLVDDAPGLFHREQGALQQIPQIVPLDVLLQHQVLLPLGGHLIHRRKIPAGTVQQPPVDLGIAGEAAQDEPLAAGLVPQQMHAAPRASLQQPFFPERLLQSGQQPLVHLHSPLTKKADTLCSQHIVSACKAL